MIEHAIQYAQKGFSVIPIKPDIDEQDKKALKKPYIKWTEFQERRASIDEIKGWWEKWPTAMVGLVTGKISGLCVVDFDSYKPGFDPELVLEYFSDSIETPTAISANKGTHLYFKLPNEYISLSGNAGALPCVDLRANGNYIIAPPSVDNSKRQYSWVNGLDVFKIDFAFLPIPYIYLIDNNIKGGGSRGGVGVNHKLTTTTSNHSDHKRPQMFMEGTRDNDLFHAANCLVKGGMHSKDINQIIEILAKSCSPPFSENEVKIKIDSALQRAERRERNIMEEVREWVLTTDGHFLTTNCHNETTMTTSNHKKSANMALLRLVEEGVLEKYGERRGCYRLVDKKQAEMNFIEYEIYEFPVKLPFGLNDLCSLYPKNIIVVAGSKSSGKTALLLNIAKENQNKFDIVYLNSEMGDEEWTMRLKNLGVKNSDEIKFKAFHCNKNFHDRMDDSKKIYFVDYLEISENFYEIAKPIRLIHEKIKDGICFISVQKKGQERLGRGAEFSMEKSRLYLSMDFIESESCTKLTIVDAKASKLDVSVAGFHKRIKIYNGSKMEAMSKEWLR